MSRLSSRQSASAASGTLSSRGSILLACAFYVLCTALFFYPILGRLTTALIGPPGDNMQDLWNTWYSQVIFASDPKRFFHTRLIFFPEGTSLIYHAFSYTNHAVFFALRSFFGLTLDIAVLVGLHNFILLLSFPFAGLGAFLLTREFTKHFLAALVGGYIFAFSPFHFAHSLHHAGISSIQFIPFFVLCVWRYLNHRTLAAYLGAVLFFVLGALSCWYYLIYNAYFLMLYYAYFAFKRRAWWLKEIGVGAIAILAGGVLLLAPLIVPMVIEGLRNPDVYWEGHNIYVADLVGFFVFHPFHLLSGLTQGVNAKLQGNAWEMSVYLGLANVALIAWGIMHRKAVSQALAFCITVIGFFMLLAAGHSLHILGRSMRFIYLPTALTTYMPILSNIRTPSRAMVYAYLFLGVAVACILKALFFDPGTRLYRWQQRAGLRRAVLAALLALIFVDFYSIARETTPVVLPPAYELIRRDAERPAAVLDLPAVYRIGSRAMMYQILHQHPIVQASIARRCAPSLNLAWDDLALQQKQLQQAGVRYIVIHKKISQEGFNVNPVAYARTYRTLFEDDEQVLFRTD